MTAVSDLGVPQRVRSKQFHHGQLSMLLSTPVTTFVYSSLQDVLRGYNASVTDVPQRSTPGNLPVIPSSLTKLATVHEAMTWSCAIATALNQEHVIITVDQARQTTHPCKFQNVVLRMGAFHTATAFLAVLGKPFGDAGPGLVCKMTH